MDPQTNVHFKTVKFSINYSYILRFLTEQLKVCHFEVLCFHQGILQTFYYVLFYFLSTGTDNLEILKVWLLILYIHKSYPAPYVNHQIFNIRIDFYSAVFHSFFFPKIIKGVATCYFYGTLPLKRTQQICHNSENGNCIVQLVGTLYIYFAVITWISVFWLFV